MSSVNRSSPFCSTPFISSPESQNRTQTSTIAPDQSTLSWPDSRRFSLPSPFPSADSAHSEVLSPANSAPSLGQPSTASSPVARPLPRRSLRLAEKPRVNYQK